MTLEFALDTFGDVTPGADGTLKPQDQVIRDVIEEAVLADQVGVDFFGLGEHHRDDFAISSPEVVLGAIAARTSRIRLGTAVTVLSSDDPIRVFQRFSTLQAISEGRAEVILGRGSFTESFPLFGFDLADYETLFNEKLDLFARLLRDRKVTWSGATRPPLRSQPVYPQPADPIRAWIGVGGTPESVMRAVHYEMPMMLAIIGGAAQRFRPYADLYRRALAEAGRPALPVGVHSPGLVADTDEAAREGIWPGYKALHDRIGRERGWAPTTRDQFEREIAHGSLYVGAPETVARKIAATVKALDLNRFEMKYSSGPVPHALLMRSVELYGTRVVPLVRDMLS
ncbi:LLM class flavin-dependent oxidoreductase [Defluviimonas sp. WL0075]|uniref:LLM class flavin-dependent oxidoreductase n=1 Tax=Albidovulum sediminicola TaxID=2984331 RepID=A0ABT2YYY2_9RHOB|nr:LLM class flavin-dependent oxidoreductase [Defluviimonas sp. WL0075]MCV2864063.1 LLM class flavin-dependent oxidoreductase [Defluviimonas sp. WL0075]